MKNFTKWFDLKSNLNFKEYIPETSEIYFREREIWFASIGLNIGIEEDGKNGLFERPVLILKKFNQKMLLIIPLTTQVKEFKYQAQYKLNGIIYGAKLSQIKLIDSKRLLRKVEILDGEQFKIIKNKFLKMF